MKPRVPLPPHFSPGRLYGQFLKEDERIARCCCSPLEMKHLIQKKKKKKKKKKKPTAAAAAVTNRCERVCESVQ